MPWRCGHSPRLALHRLCPTLRRKLSADESGADGEIQRLFTLGSPPPQENIVDVEEKALGPVCQHYVLVVVVGRELLNLALWQLVVAAASFASPHAYGSLHPVGHR